ncbi:MAG TPA: hypothetical protein VIH95_11110 [Acidimicrobiales bacterium]
MRRISTTLFISLGALLGIVAVGAPAGAATQPGRALHAHLGIPSSSRPLITSSVPPISKGYLEVADLAGNLTFTPGTVPQPTGTVTGSSISIQLDAPSFPGQIPGVPMTLTVSTDNPSQPLHVGQIYGAGSTGSVQVTSTNNCGVQSGDIALAQIDQLTETAGSITSAAVQFGCVALGGPYLAVSGAFAYNIVPTTPHQGYYTYETNGALTGFGTDNYLNYLGDLSATPLNQPIVGMAQTADGGGYWMVASDGGIFAFGDAGFYGSAGSLPLNKPIVGMAATTDGKGYWLVASDGGIFAYGDAGFYGSTGSETLNKPIVGMAATPGGKGYWLVASDGGIFAYGDAGFYGSTGNLSLNKPVVGMTPTPNGKGYWFVASDGGIFAYGDAGFHGSTGSLTLNQPIVGMAQTADGGGYWLVAADGGIFGYGDAPYYGSLPGDGVSVNDVAGLSTLPGLSF